MASEALTKISDSDLSVDNKKYLSTMLLAYQGLAKESYDEYYKLERSLPSLVGEKGTRRKERTAWVMYAQSLLSAYERDKERYDKFVQDIISSSDLSILCENQL
jgi:hypothetical protein